MKTNKLMLRGHGIHRSPILFILLGCVCCFGFVFAAVDQGRTYTDDEGRAMLRSELGEFERYVESTMKAASEVLQSRDVKADELKKFDAWQSLQKTRFKEALSQTDPLAALVDAWAVSKSLTRYLNQQASSDELPDTTRDVALDMLKRREDRIAYIASRYLPEDSLATLSHGIESFTTEQPIPDSELLPLDSRKWSNPLFSVWAKSQSAVSSVLQVPLMPGRALKGVSDSGKALSGIRETTAEAVLVASQLPESIRTEFQIALADLVEKRAEIIEMLNAVDSVSTNLRATAESSHLTAIEIQQSLILAREIVPAGESLAVAVERAVNASTDLIKAIGERPATKGEGREFDIADYQAAAVTVTEAASEVRQMLVEISGLVNTDPALEKPKGGEPFDIQEYGITAEAIQHSTAEIRALLGELRDIAEDDVFCDRLNLLWAQADASAQQTAGHVRGVVDHIAWRLVQVVAVGFVFACLHTWFRAKKGTTH